MKHLRLPQVAPGFVFYKIALTQEGHQSHRSANTNGTAEHAQPTAYLQSWYVTGTI